jgi:uncharacterized membrane protein
MSTTPDKLVERYLKHLEVELDDLPRDRRREIVDEISGHIAEARSSFAESESDVRNVLEDLGDPAEIAAEARERFGVQPKKSGFLEIAALVLLLAGGLLLPVAGWLIGVALLWASSVWNTRDKLIGTLVVPGGLALPLALFFLGSSLEPGRSCILDPETGREISCTGTSDATSLTEVLGIVLFALLVLAPFVTTAYLARRMRSRAVAVG